MQQIHHKLVEVLFAGLNPHFFDDPRNARFSEVVILN